MTEHRPPDPTFGAHANCIESERRQKLQLLPMLEPVLEFYRLEQWPEFQTAPLLAAGFRTNKYHPPALSLTPADHEQSITTDHSHTSFQRGDDYQLRIGADFSMHSGGL